jgi:hypothetical protein
VRVLANDGPPCGTLLGVTLTIAALEGSTVKVKGKMVSPPVGPLVSWAVRLFTAASLLMVMLTTTCVGETTL